MTEPKCKVCNDQGDYYVEICLFEEPILVDCECKESDSK
jgi:hypothetical protein